MSVFLNIRFSNIQIWFTNIAKKSNFKYQIRTFIHHVGSAQVAWKINRVDHLIEIIMYSIFVFQNSYTVLPHMRDKFILFKLQKCKKSCMWKRRSM